MRRSSFITSSITAAVALAVAAAQAADGPQPLIVASDSPANWLGSGVSALDGVAQLTVAQPGGLFVCSGSLLAGGQYIVTAAHCLTDDNTGAINAASVTAQFKSGSVTTVSASYSIAPGWAGFGNSAGNGSDIALIKLAAPVTTVAGYALSNSNDVGKTFLMAGYGLVGTGSTGAAGSAPQALHYGYNVFDTTDDALTTALRNGGYGAALGGSSTKLGETYVFDFDNGNANQNAITRLYALAGVNFASDLGQGSAEAMIAGGDSGGGDFVVGGNGMLLLSGVHSYGWDLCTNLANGGIADSLANCVVAPQNPKGASFGSLGGSTAVFSSLAWIESVTAVPEPTTGTLLLAGLACCGWLARRRPR